MTFRLWCLNSSLVHDRTVQDAMRTNMLCVLCEDDGGFCLFIFDLYIYDVQLWYLLSVKKQWSSVYTLCRCFGVLCLRPLYRYCGIMCVIFIGVAVLCVSYVGIRDLV
jgi:hypothetical protein